jgi:ADP-heptose:LPS heptosyltransferase
MATTLVIRLSSLGDVAMLIPTLYSVAGKNPKERFLLVTKKPLEPLFFKKPDNLEIFPVYTKGRHKGLTGLWRLIKDLKATVDTPLKIADMHSVIRSFIITSCFRLKGAEVAVIDKGRKEKKALIRPKHKKLFPLKTSIERFREVLAHLGYDTTLDFPPFFPEKTKNEEIRIGIAPFAKHQGKIYPFRQMEEVIRILNSSPAVRIFLFGGKEDKAQLEGWSKKYERVELVAGLLPFPDELHLMSDLDLMVSMDSANMHLASLVNTPVVSIWGATHPYAGFYGYNQLPDNAVQIDMECRPCAIFGEKPCFRGDYACMKQIRAEMIVAKIIDVVKATGPSKQKLFLPQSKNIPLNTALSPRT